MQRKLFYALCGATILLAAIVLNVEAQTRVAYPTMYLTAMPAVVEVGEKSYLSWRLGAVDFNADGVVTDADLAYIDQATCELSGGSLSGSYQGMGAGVFTGPLSASHAYTVTCSGNGFGTVSRSVTIDVRAAEMPLLAPIVSFTASPTSVLSGSSATLTFGMEPVDFNYDGRINIDDYGMLDQVICTLSGGLSGSYVGAQHTVSTGPLTSSQTYTLTCDGPRTALVSKSLTVTVAAAPAPAPQSPYKGTPFSVGGSKTVIQAEDFDNGGEGIAYHDIDTSNSGGGYRSGGVDIQTTSDTGGGYNVGWTRVGEWLEYTLDVTQAGSYDFAFRIASAGSNAQFHAEIDGVNVTGQLTLPNTQYWQTWQTLTKSGVQLNAGKHILRLSFDVLGSTGAVGNFNYIEIQPAISVPAAPPPAPINLSATADSSSQVRLVWNDVASETGYVIERLFGSSWQTVGTTAANVTVFTNSGLAASTLYSYRVKAVSAAGSSSYSNQVNVTTLGAPTSGPAPTPLITLLDGEVPAGAGIHVHAIGSTLGVGTPISVIYEWDFGDTTSKSRHNKLRGWNAAHVYHDPGTYPVTLTITNAAGNKKSVTANVTVTQPNRTKIYVSDAGDDSNSGLSESDPIRTVSRAKEKINNNTEILFRKGDTFSVPSSISISGRQNVLIGSYGSATAKPILRYDGSLIYGVAIVNVSSSNDVTIRGLTFDSKYTSFSTDEKQMPNGISPGGKNIVIEDNYFENVHDAINNNKQPQGVYAFDNETSNVIRGYLAWAQGSDQVFVGNVMPDSVYSHNLRNGGTDRLLVANNTFTNLKQLGGVKGTLTIHLGTYHYITGNTLNVSNMSVGPLGEGDGLSNTAARSRWVVVENNIVNNATIEVDHGAENVSVRGNTVNNNGGTSIQVEGYNSSYDRTTANVDVTGNIGNNTSTTGKFLRVAAGVNGIKVRNNIYRAPNLAPGSYGSAAVYVSNGDLSDFTEISENVWPAPKSNNYMNYVSPTFGTLSGYRTPAQWNAYPQVAGRDTFSNSFAMGGNDQLANAIKSGVLYTSQVLGLILALFGIGYAAYRYRVSRR